MDSAAELREPLLEHVQGFTEAQRLHVPSQVKPSPSEINTHLFHLTGDGGAVQRAAEGE